MKAATDMLIRRLDGLMPQTAIILGSGLGDLVEAMSLPVKIPYADLEGFPQSGVSGHAGQIVAGSFSGTPVLMLSGRVHYYERGDAAAMRPVIETLAAIGVRQLLQERAVLVALEHPGHHYPDLGAAARVMADQPLHDAAREVGLEVEIREIDELQRRRP